MAEETEMGQVVNGRWRVLAEPHEEYHEDTGENLGGLRIMLTDGKVTREVSRVGYHRKNTERPKQSFEKSVQDEIKRAKVAAETLNTLLIDEPAGTLL